MAISTFIERTEHTQIEIECMYWRLLFHRVTATIKLVAKIGLPFGEHKEFELSKRQNNILTCFG